MNHEQEIERVATAFILKMLEDPETRQRLAAKAVLEMMRKQEPLDVKFTPGEPYDFEIRRCVITEQGLREVKP